METVPTALWVVVLLVALAIVFDFMNGFHDAANSIATVVSTGVLKPGQAVVFAAFFNFIAIFVFHLSVAATIGKGIVEPGIVDTHVVFGALVGAIAWNLITWWHGLPSSSSHALIGGLCGVAVTLVRERLDRRIRGADDLAAALAAPAGEARHFIECAGHLMFARGDYPLRLSDVAFVKVGAVSGAVTGLVVITPALRNALTSRSTRLSPTR